MIKMETNQTITYGILGILSLAIAAFGGTMYLTEDQLDNAYVCSVNEQVGFFYGGISGTAYTAYPYSENRTDYERCIQDGNKGNWIPLKEYAEARGISIDQLLQPIEELVENYNYTGSAVKYLCNQNECVRI